LRTVPRNFPGRSGTREDSVFLCSPETATASALRGVITDPRDLDMPYPRVGAPSEMVVHTELLEAPLPPEQARSIDLVKGPNIASLPMFDALPDALSLQILLKVGDDFSTDEILPAGAKVLPYRSNIPRIAEFAFSAVDTSYPKRARQVSGGDGHAVVGGKNYGQGSSREHAALAPRYLGLRAVLAKSFSRIHRANLINFGVLPLRFEDPGDYDRLEPGMEIQLSGLHSTLSKCDAVRARLGGNATPISLSHDLSPRETEILRAGGLINHTGRLDRHSPQ
jgi:aconitate hydratase